MQPGKLKIAFLDVGQGDTIVITHADTHEAIVIDCTNANAVLDYLAQEQIEYLRGVLVSHLHADHYSEVDYLLARYNIVPGLNACELLSYSRITDKNKERILTQGRAKDDALIQDEDAHSLYYERVQEKANWTRRDTIATIKRWCEDDKTKFINPQVERKPLALKFEGELAKNVLLLHPYIFDIPELQARGLNSTSVVLRVNGAGSSALLTGDLEPAGWKELCKNYCKNYPIATLRSDILKFPHHGGSWKKDDVDDLLDIVNPSTVIISVGSKGYQRYTHPHPDVFEALKKRPNIRLLCTQATNQCQQNVMAQRGPVRDLLVKQASKNGQKLIGSKRGCPCAGTVVVELGESAQVIQPEILFHQQTIIPHFQNHQCRFGHVVMAKAESSVESFDTTARE